MKWNRMRLRRALEKIWRDERGQGLAELVVVLPLMLIMVSGIMFFGRVLYTALAVDAASFDGARASVETLTRDRGPDQGLQAAALTLSGYYLDPSAASINVVPLSNWERGSSVLSHICYNVRVDDIPLVRWFFSGQSVQVNVTTVMAVDYYKSRWTAR